MNDLISWLKKAGLALSGAALLFSGYPAAAKTGKDKADGDRNKKAKAADSKKTDGKAAKKGGKTSLEKKWPEKASGSG